MGVVDLTKGDTVTTSGTSPNEEKNDVEEDVSTVEEQKCKEPSDWRSEGPGCFKSFTCTISLQVILHAMKFDYFISGKRYSACTRLQALVNECVYTHPKAVLWVIFTLTWS